MKSVHEICKLTNISRRTLLYYDEINLLNPSALKASGYRLYNDAALSKLWKILFYKELGFSLQEIKKMVNSSIEYERLLLEEHKRDLILKAEKLKKIQSSIDELLDNQFDMSLLRDHDKEKIKQIQLKYQKDTLLSQEEKVELHRFLTPWAMSTATPVNSVSKKAIILMGTDWDEFIRIGLQTIELFKMAMSTSSSSKKTFKAVTSFKKLVFLIDSDISTFHEIANSYFSNPTEPDKILPGLSNYVGQTLQQTYEFY